VLEEEGIKAITLPVEASRFGAVESLAEAQKCADLFKVHREEIDGLLVTLPNFGDERAWQTLCAGRAERAGPYSRVQ